MKVNMAKMLTLLDDRKQFVLPIYQRQYSWQKQHCQQLWDDIIRVGKDERLYSYFLGPIVSKSIGTVAVQRFFGY